MTELAGRPLYVAAHRRARRTGSVKWRCSRSRRDAVGALDGFRRPPLFDGGAWGVHFSPNPTGAIFGVPALTGCDFAAVLVALVAEDFGACRALLLTAGRCGR